MRQSAKTIYRIFSYFFVLVILFFLGQNLLTNWRGVRNYHFIFDYSNLAVSFLLLWLSLVGLSLVWNTTLRMIESKNRLASWTALRIYLYSEFGKYLPGNIWTILGKVYWGEKSGLDKKHLLVSSFLDGVLHTAATFILGLAFLLLSLGDIAPVLYLVAVFVAAGSLIFVQPRIFYPSLNFLLRRLKQTAILPENFLSYGQMLKITAYYLVVAFINAAAFFFFARSVIVLPPHFFLALSGIYSLAMALGVAAIFAPSGLGVREGVLVALLGPYFPIGVAIVLAFLTRLWLTMGEILLFVLVYLCFKLKKFIYCLFIFGLKFFPAQGVVVLLYHQINDSGSRLAVSPENFKEQLKFLKTAGYQTVSLAEVDEFLRQEKKLPAKSALISFDDGFGDNFSLAWPLLLAQGFQAAFFIVTSYIGGPSAYCRDEADKNKPMMTAEEIKAMFQSGFFIANHFHSHRNLIDLSETEIKSEYEQSRQILKNIIGEEKNLSCVSYPRNRKNQKVMAVLKALGVELAFGGSRGVITEKTDPLDIPRTEIFSSDSILRFIFKLSSPFYFLSKIRQKIR